MNARNVIENAPEKFKNRPNLGTIIEKRPVQITTRDLYIIHLNYRQKLVNNLYSWKSSESW